MKKVIVLLLLFCFISSASLFAYMPVIDPTAIAQAISNLAEMVSEWQDQLQMFATYYQKINAAVKTIQKGDFEGIVSGISQMAGLASGLFPSSSNVLDSIGDSLAGVSDMGYSILDLVSNSQFLATHATQLADIVSKNWEQYYKEDMKNITDSYKSSVGEGISKTWETIGAGTSLVQSALSLVSQVGSDLLPYVSIGRKINNDIADMFIVEPENLADIYYQELVNKISTSTGGQASDIKGLEKLINDTQKEVTKYQTAMFNTKSGENETLYNQNKDAYENAEKTLKNLNTLLEYSNGMLDNIKTIYNEQERIDDIKAQNQIVNTDIIKKTEKLAKSAADEITTSARLTGNYINVWGKDSSDVNGDLPANLR